MKRKLQVLAATVVLAATAGTAQARIQDAMDGNSEFIFSAYDINVGRGYTYDLENSGWVTNADVRFTDFVGSDGGVAVTPTGAVVMTPNASGTFFDILLPGFAGFLANVTLSDVLWNLAAGDSKGRKQMLTTLQDPGSNLLKNGKISDAVGRINQYVGAVNGYGTHYGFDVADDGWATTVAGDGTAYSGNTPTWGHAIGNQCNFTGCNTTAGLGGSTNLYMFYQTSTSVLSSNGGLVKLHWNGNPVFGQVYEASDGYHLRIAAVPEPSSYAMLLGGLGLLGFMARRRLGHRA